MASQSPLISVSNFVNLILAKNIPSIFTFEKMSMHLFFQTKISPISFAILLRKRLGTLDHTMALVWVMYALHTRDLA